MTPYQLTHLARQLNALRVTLTRPDQHETLDDICATVAIMADAADSEYGRDFRDQCVMGMD